MSNDDTYNGWSNKETWIVWHWYNNDESLYDAALSWAEDSDSLAELTNRLRHTIEGPSFGELSVTSGIHHDLLSHAIRRIKFYELAKAFMDETQTPA